ncbi:MAG: hypothetical protein HF973_19570, partial [Chloroflexi bacterium]|nr:hypothetical protein [Chloroflexota bacterium]
MRWQPPAGAASITDFAPPGAQVHRINNRANARASRPFDHKRDNLLIFSEERAGIVVEKDTFSRGMNLEITELPTAVITATDTITSPTGSLRFMRFQLDMVETGQTRPVAQFATPVRLVLDLRPFTRNLDLSGGTFYLAYRDPENPAVWHDVPLAYQSNGLISAEVTHFSEWTAGWRPEPWTPQWTPPAVAEFSGAATYSYALNVPPGRNGLQPSLTLSYNSRALDGAIFQMGHGPVATGWSLGDIYVAREGVKIDYANSNYKLIHPDRFRLVLNGTGYELVPEGSTLGSSVRYYAKDMPGLRVYRYYDPAAPNQEGLFWKVRTGDGTEYRLGYTADSEEWQKLVRNGTLEISGHRGRNGTGDEQKTSAVNWYVDRVTDTFDNRLVYAYNNQTVTKYACDRGDTCSFALEHRQHKVRIASISYNFDANGTPASRIAFHARGYTDIWGNWQENTMGAIQNILIYHGNVNGNPVREYRFESQIDTIAPAVADCPDRSGNYPESRQTRVLTQIREWVGTDRNFHDQNESGAYALPPVTLSYTAKPHYYQEGNAGRPCFSFWYLAEVKNGYGGFIRFEYGTDGRSQGRYKVNNYFNIEWPGVGFNYFVTREISNDGRNPDAVTEYSYYKPCYGQKWNGALGSMPAAFTCPYADDSLLPDHGSIVGFARVTKTTRGYSNELIARQISWFHQDENQRGRPYQVDTGVPDAGSQNIATLLTRSQTTYNTDIFGPNVPFTFVEETKSYQYFNGVSLSSKTRYDYNESYQGNAQYGNLTHIYQYDNANAPNNAPYRATRRWYYPNTGIWIVNKLAAEGVYEGNSWNIISGFWNYYDGTATQSAPPTRGFVTRARQFQPIPCSEAPGGGGAGCAAARQTVDTVYTRDAYGNQKTTTSYRDYGYRTFTGSWAEIQAGFPAQAAATKTITYDGGYNLYPVRLDVSGPNLTTQTTSFAIYGFNAPLDGFQRQPGLLKSVTEPNGATTKYEYDPFGRLHAVYDGYSFAGFGDADPWNGDPVTQYRYWDNSFNHSTTFLDPANDRPFIVATVQRPDSWPYPADSSSGYSYVSQTMYDGFGRPIQERQIYASVAGYSQTREIFTTTEYDAQGQVACQTTPFDVPFYYDRGETWPNGVFYNAPCTSKPHTATTYDALGRVRFVTAPDGRQTEHRYSINNNLGPMRLHHNVINPNRQRMRFSYDSLNQLAQVTELTGNCGSYWGYACGAGDATWAEYAATKYEYSVSGNLTKVTDTANNVTTMNYNGFGRKTSMNDPDMGAWQYEYDPAGNLTRQTDANGGILCFEYDALNRLTRKGEGNTAVPCAITDELAAYQYDTAQNGIGQLAQVTWPGGSDAFFYDSLGRMYKQTRQIDNRAYTMETLSYDALHRPLQIRYPNGEIVTMTYDREGENSLKAGNDWLVNDVRYNGRGQIKYLDRGTVPNTNPDTWYTYYPASDNFRLQQIRHGSLNSDNRPDFSYEYDPVGNITKMTAVTANYGTDTQTFTYDHLNRLKTASAAGPAAYNHTYAYDTIGNMISRTEDGVTYTYSYGVQPHAVTGVAVSGGQPFSFIYDANGNMETRNDADGNFTQAWDAENRLVSVTEGSDVTTFVYDADGSRVKTVKPDGTIIYYPFPNYEEEIRPAAPTPTPTNTPTPTPTNTPTNTPSPTPTAVPATLTLNPEA